MIQACAADTKIMDDPLIPERETVLSHRTDLCHHLRNFVLRFAKMCRRKGAVDFHGFIGSTL